jgi:hypothetical protein
MHNTAVETRVMAEAKRHTNQCIADVSQARAVPYGVPCRMGQLYSQMFCRHAHRGRAPWSVPVG